MKKAFLFLVLPAIVAACTAPEGGARRNETRASHRTVMVARTPGSQLPAVASGPGTRISPAVGGVLPKAASIGRPLEMLNPLAPASLGGQTDFAASSQERFNASANGAVRQELPGIQFLTIRPNW